MTDDGMMRVLDSNGDVAGVVHPLDLIGDPQTPTDGEPILAPEPVLAPVYDRKGGDRVGTFVSGGQGFVPLGEPIRLHDTTGTTVVGADAVAEAQGR